MRLAARAMVAAWLLCIGACNDGGAAATGDARAAEADQAARDNGPAADGRADGAARSCKGPGEDTTRGFKCTPDVFTVGGVHRGAIVCRPDPLPKGPLPVVLGFHGGGGNAKAWMSGNSWHDMAARHGFVAVYMQGCRTQLTDCSVASGNYHWSVGKKGAGETVDDQAYVLATIGRLETVHKLTIDRGCLFATGHSLGGIYSYSLLCDQPGLLAAIGPISAPPTDATCTPHAGTSIFHIHGTVDQNVPFTTGCCSLAQQTQGNPAYLAACSALPRCFNPVNWWPPVRDGKHPFGDVTGLDAMATKGLGCGGTWKTIKTEGKTTCSAYPNCAGGRAAEVCLVDGVDHSLQELNKAFDISAYLWGRFAAQPPRQP